MRNCAFRFLRQRLVPAVLATSLPLLASAESSRVVITPQPGYTIVWDGNNGAFPGSAPPGNLALASNGSSAFGSSEFGGAHQIVHINDAHYGNGFSWIANFAAVPADTNPFIGVAFGKQVAITNIAWSRHNLNVGTPAVDRSVGTYTLQVTTVTNVNAATPEKGNPATGWTSVGTVRYQSGTDNDTFSAYLRHRYDVLYNGNPVAATGMRIKVSSSQLCLDEIEINAPLDPPPSLATYLAITNASGIKIRWEGPEGKFYTTNTPANAPINRALATQGSTAFGSGELGSGQYITNVIDGHYGNARSWLANVAQTTNVFIGVSFGGMIPIRNFAWSRDNGDDAEGVFTNRCLGSYTVQITTVANVSASTPETGSPGTGWANLGTIHYKKAGPQFAPHLRHLFCVSQNAAPISATGLRIKVSTNAICIDELEVNSVIAVNMVDKKSEVFYLGNIATLKLEIDNRTLPALDGALEYTLTDFHSNIVQVATQALSIAANTLQPVSVGIPCANVGYLAVGLRILAGNEVKFEHARVSSLAVFEEPHSFLTESRFGTYMIGNRNLLANIVPKGFYTSMSKVGVRLGTMDTWWRDIEPVNGNYDWAIYDEWFAKMRSQGILPMPHLFGTPVWASSYESGDAGNYWEHPPADMQEWRQFVRDFVTRYQSWLTYLRIWNEPNVGFWRGTPAQYAEMVIAASQEAKAVKPSIKIVVEAVDDVYNNPYVFFDAMHAAGATPHWDVIAIHNYWLNNSSPPERTVFAARYQALRDWRDAHKPEAEIWDTEFACMSEDWYGGFWVGVGETKQAQWLARGTVIGLSKGLNKMIWFPGYSWPDSGAAPYYNPAGLLRVDLLPKPALVAYRTTALALSDATYLTNISKMPVDQFGQVFQGPTGYVTALWSIDAAHAKPISLKYPAAESEVTIMDLMGKTRKIGLTPQGTATVEVDENMNFIFSPQMPVGLVPTVALASDTNSQLSVHFTDTLQATPQVSGPWTNLPDATTPLPVTPSNSQRFFRAKQ